MRTLKNVLMMGLMPIMALALVVGCTKNEAVTDPGNGNTPVVEKDSTIKLGKTTVSASLAGGTYLIEYTIENPHQGEKISAEAAESWVKNFNYGITGALGFEVEANPTDAERECLVTVKYRYAEDVVFTVKQGAAVKAGFALENVTATYFDYTVDIIPENKTLPYIVMSATPEYIVASGFEAGEDYYEDDLAYFAWLGQFYGKSAAQVMQDRAKVGDQRGVTVSGATSGVPYRFYCYYFDYDSGALLSDVQIFIVETPRPEKISVEFTMTTEIVDGCLVKANVTPNAGFEGDYYFDVLNKNLIDSYLEDRLMSEFLTDKERVIEYWWSNSVQSMMQDMSADQILANYTCQGTNPDGSPKSYYEFELLANSTYYLFAYAMEGNAFCCSEPQVLEIQTGNVSMSDNVITPSISKITARTATFTFTPSNDDYYVAGWEKASDWATYGNNDAERQEYLIHNLDYYLLSGVQSTNVLNLEADTEYVVYAFGSRGGVATTSQIFTTTFKTKSGEAGSVSISLPDRGYYDAADFSEYSGYEHLANYSGYAVCAIEVVFSDEEHGDYFFDIYDWTNREHEVHTDKDLMDHYVWSINEHGSMTATHTYSFLEFGRVYEISGVVLDLDGQFSSLYRRWIRPTYDGCGDAADYVAWWDAYQNSQSSGPGLQSLVVNELFKQKGEKGERVSQKTFESKREVMSADEVIVRR